jgi:hypothetical protein
MPFRTDAHQDRIAIFGFGLNKEGVVQNDDPGKSGLLQILRELLNCESGAVCPFWRGGRLWHRSCWRRRRGGAGLGLSKGGR